MPREEKKPSKRRGAISKSSRFLEGGGKKSSEKGTPNPAWCKEKTSNPSDTPDRQLEGGGGGGGKGGRGPDELGGGGEPGASRPSCEKEKKGGRK